MSVERADFNEFRDAETEILDRLIDINQLSKNIARTGNVVRSQGYTDYFFDMLFWRADISGDSGNSVLDDMDQHKVTHKVLIFMSNGTIEFNVYPNQIIKVDFISGDDSIEETQSQVAKSELGLDLITDSQAQLYLRLLEMMAEAGVGTDLSYSYQNKDFFENFEKTLTELLQSEKVIMDGPDVIRKSTVERAKLAIDKITSKDHPLERASRYVNMLDDLEEGHTNRNLVVTSITNLDNSNPYMVTEICYTYEDDSENRIEEVLYINSDSSHSYNRTVREIPETLDFGTDGLTETEIYVESFRREYEQHLVSRRNYALSKELGLDQITPDPLKKLQSVLQEASTL